MKEPKAALSWHFQYREQFQKVFFLALFLFLVRARSIMVQNLESEVDVDGDKSLFRSKTSRSDASGGTGHCRDEREIHWTIFLTSVSAYRFAKVSVRPCVI